MNKSKRMMRTMLNSVFLPAIVGAMALSAAPWAGADEAGSPQLRDARLAVEKSSLTKEAKIGILMKADQAAIAGVPSEDVAIIISRGLKQGAPSAHIESFLDTSIKVKKRDLPVRIILDRIEQGLAKGVPAERIAEATERLSAHLATAKPIVETIEKSGVKSGRGGRSHDAVETVARALEKSIPTDAIMRTGEKVRDRKGSIVLFARAVDTMTIFISSGMRTEQASRMVHTAIDKGYSERDLETMERYMVEGLKKNRSMNDVVSGMESGMERGEMRDRYERSGGGMMGGTGSGGMGGAGSGMGPGMPGPRR